MTDDSKTPESAATPGDAGASNASTAPPTVEERIVELEAQLSEAQENFLRAKAETENTRRRAQTDITNAHKYAAENFAESLVPVKDSLEAALQDQSASPETLRSGVELTLRQLVSAFERAKITEVNPAGAKFDPHRHQAISMVDADIEANNVVSVLQKGYQINDRMLRPALVTVAKPKST